MDNNKKKEILNYLKEAIKDIKSGDITDIIFMYNNNGNIGMHHSSKTYTDLFGMIEVAKAMQIIHIINNKKGE